jgi:O-antigen/teichoic acid export membrane protein
MSRFRRTFHGVASSYILLAATAVYSLASVPVALHYLDLERFGLWMVMGTLVGYLNLMDAGMTWAVARLLVDHKDNQNGGSYGSLIQTGWLVSIVQGTIIFAMGLLLAGTFARLLLPLAPALHPELTQLVKWQCGIVALMFATRMLNLILTAHQRMDLSNYINVAGLLMNFAAQWIFFHLGYGVLSLMLGSLVALVIVVAGSLPTCIILKLFPQAGRWGRVSWQNFRELFNYGKDVFLVAVGAQLIMASQVIVITRMMGPESAGVWGTGLRLFNLLNQFVWRVSDMSGSAFAEMLARGEMDRLHDRYRSVAILTFSLAGWAAVSFALCNSLFVPIWTHGRIHWPVAYDCLLAVWMILLAVIHCHNCFILLTKQVGFMRYIYFVEGIVFVTLSFLVARRGGLPAIIGSSILCSVAFSGAYGIQRIGHFFGLSLREVAVEWLRPMGKVLLFFLPAAVLTWWLLAPVAGVPRLVVNVLLAGSLGAYLFLRFGIPIVFRTELLRRVPARMMPLLKRLFLQAVN